MDLGVGGVAGGVGADDLEDVLDRHGAASVAPGRDRAAVEHEPGQVESRKRHHGRGDRLVAADDAHEPVEQVAARNELDRVGDHLTRDERRAHARGSHRDAVGDRDRVELERRAAGPANALLHVSREQTMVEVARHRLDPRRRDTDQRRARSASVKPAPFSIARAGARSTPSVNAALCRFAGCDFP